MNAELLLALYDRAADAPDAVSRLRRFVLDLAVRGKLVPQDPADEPASELLKRIAAEKIRLEKAGLVKNKSNLAAVADEEAPYKVPPLWQWVRFGNIVDFSAGRTPPRKDSSFWNTGDHAWVSIADMKDGKTVETTKETVSRKARDNVFKSGPKEPGTMIMSFKLTIGKVARLGIPAFHNEAIISIHPHFEQIDPYLFKTLPDLARGGDTKGAIKGATLNRESISNILIPLPPLAEQQRIVAKVDELMALCDRLEKTRTAREETRDRLTKAGLAPLSAPDTDDASFRSHARFAVDVFPVLTARADQVKHLRRTILDLAVRGKLAPQELCEGHGADLKIQIQDAWKDLVSAGVIKTVRKWPRVSEKEVPFDVPSNWGVVHLGEAMHLINGRAFKPSDWTPQGLPIVRIQNLNNTSAAFNRFNGDVKQKFMIDTGDFLISWSGTPGTSFGAHIWNRGPAILNQHIFKAILVGGVFDTAFLKIAINSRLLELIEQAHGGVGLQHITKPKLEAIALTLPPLAEQQRIVAKIDELMALCDRLEAGLDTVAKGRDRLLESVVRAALEPAVSAHAG